VQDHPELVTMTTAKPAAIASHVTLPYRVALNVSAIDMTEEQFARLCSNNGDLRLELSAERELIIMPPAFSETGWQELELAMQVGIWAKQDGTGRTFGPTAGFTLPNGAIRAPDVSWIPLSKWEALNAEERYGFAKTCPDFVIELRSSSDSLAEVQRKMAEYMENGARLGWLIDPQNRRVHLYRPGQPIEILEGPTAVSGDPVLPGFTLDLSPIW
jgi:Uma2 family endonuclease